MNDSLRGLTLLITQSEPGNQLLCQRIEALGGRALAWPAIQIAPLLQTEKILNPREYFSRYIGIIFVSTSAVQYGLDYLLSAQTFAPTAPCLLAIGKTTAALLQDKGLSPVYPEHEANSEALLALPLLQSIAGQKWLIVRGQGGREYLADTLSQRGAEVHYLEVYQRKAADFPEESLSDFLDHQSVHAIVFASMAAVKAFLKSWDGSCEVLSQLPILVVSERMYNEVSALGFGCICLAPSAYPQGIVDGLKQLKFNIYNDFSSA